MCFLSTFWLDCKTGNLVLSCKIPSSFLLSVRGAVFSSGMPTALGPMLVSADHQFLILERAEFQGWNQVIPLSARCEMSLAKSLGNNFLMTFCLMMNCFMLPQSPPHAWLWLIKLSWERKKKVLIYIAAAGKGQSPAWGPKEGQESICWDWAWFNSSYKASWQLSRSDRLIIRLSLNAKGKVIYIGFTPLASRKDPALC